MAASDAQLARLLALVPFLQGHPGISVDEAAAAFGITADTLVKDLNILWYCGLPGQGGGDLIDVDMELVEGEGVIYLANADYLTRPLTLTPDEAFSLLLALEYVGGLTDTELSTAAGSALGKLRAALGERALDAATVSVATASVVVRDAVAEAIERRVSLELVYDGQRRYSTPTVDPARVVVRHGVAYLQAWSHERGDWRTFRMDRIADARVTDEVVSPHGDAPEVPADWNDALPFTSEVALTVNPEGAWVAEYHPVRSVQQHEDGTSTITLGVVDDAWLRSLLLRLGPAVVHVEPPEAAEGARMSARIALDAYASAGRVSA